MAVPEPPLIKLVKLPPCRILVALSAAEHACKLGLEGIVSKRIDMAYSAGPSKSWLKIKNPTHPAMMRIQEGFERERLR